MRSEGRSVAAVIRRRLPNKRTEEPRGRHFRHGAGSDGSPGPSDLPVEQMPARELFERLDVALHELQDQGLAVEEKWMGSPGDDGLSSQASALLTEWVAALRDASLGMERALLDVNLGETRPSGNSSVGAKPAPMG